MKLKCNSSDWIPKWSAFYKTWHSIGYREWSICFKSFSNTHLFLSGVLSCFASITFPFIHSSHSSFRMPYITWDSCSEAPMNFSFISTIAIHQYCLWLFTFIRYGCRALTFCIFPTESLRIFWSACQYAKSYKKLLFFLCASSAFCPSQCTFCIIDNSLFWSCTCVKRIPKS